MARVVSHKKSIEINILLVQRSMIYHTGYHSYFHLEPLDELTSRIRELFSPIVNKNVPVPEFSDHPYTANELQVTCSS